MIVLKKNEYISYDKISHNPYNSGLRRQKCDSLTEAQQSGIINHVKVFITGINTENIAFDSVMIPVMLEEGNGVAVEDKVYYLVFTDVPLTKINKRYLMNIIGTKYKMKPIARCPYCYYSYPILELERVN